MGDVCSQHVSPDVFAHDSDNLCMHLPVIRLCLIWQHNQCARESNPVACLMPIGDATVDVT